MFRFLFLHRCLKLNSIFSNFVFLGSYHALKGPSPIVSIHCFPSRSIFHQNPLPKNSQLTSFPKPAKYSPSSTLPSTPPPPPCRIPKTEFRCRQYRSETTLRSRSIDIAIHVCSSRRGESGESSRRVAVGWSRWCL